MPASISPFVWKARVAGSKSTPSAFAGLDGIKRILSLQTSSGQRTFVISNIKKKDPKAIRRKLLGKSGVRESVKEEQSWNVLHKHALCEQVVQSS